jgi:hypothetical protein
MTLSQLRARAVVAKERGLCGCGKELIGGTRTTCGACVESKREEKRRRRAAGLCIECGAKSDGYVLCAAHRRRLNARLAEQWASGKCQCGRPAERGVSCRRCADRMAARNRRVAEARRSTGLCYDCGAPAATARSRCERCLGRVRELQSARKAARKVAGQ